MSEDFENKVEEFLNGLCEMATKYSMYYDFYEEAEILINGFPRWCYYNTSDDEDWYALEIIINLPFFFYKSLSNIEIKKENIKKCVIESLPSFKIPDFGSGVAVIEISFAAVDEKDPKWRERGREALTGAGINNQGRVRSDNIPRHDHFGLRFRSKSEINMFKALEELGYPFSPLPVVIQDDNLYPRIEPDFVVFTPKKVIIIEVDGDYYHNNKTALEEQNRLDALISTGAQVFRIDAYECRTKDGAAKALHNTFTKHRII
jgi:hypothetical protein